MFKRHYRKDLCGEGALQSEYMYKSSMKIKAADISTQCICPMNIYITIALCCSLDMHILKYSASRVRESQISK